MGLLRERRNHNAGRFSLGSETTMKFYMRFYVGGARAKMVILGLIFWETDFPFFLPRSAILFKLLIFSLQYNRRVNHQILNLNKGEWDRIHKVPHVAATS